MTEIKLTYSQKRVLRELKAAGPDGIKRSCTNATMCALERRGLARWDMIDRRETWFATENPE